MNAWTWFGRGETEIDEAVVWTRTQIGGIDLDPEDSLSRLVARLLEAVPDVRLRLGSIEATEIDDLLVDLLASKRYAERTESTGCLIEIEAA